MRLNQFIAHAAGLSRRQADTAISAGQVRLNGKRATLGVSVAAGDRVELDGQLLALPQYQTIILHKPIGYVTSRVQQSQAPTIYALLPPNLHVLKPVGRLDRDSSGLLVLTNDGELAQRLQHPSRGKWKRYELRLNRPLAPEDRDRLQKGVKLSDGMSRLQIDTVGRDRRNLVVRLQEGRNRQIRRTVAALGYRTQRLHRSELGELRLGQLAAGEWRTVEPQTLAADSAA